MKKKIYIMVDMEGITGVVKAADVMAESPEYNRFRKLMTADVNAAIEGAFEGGATEILVNDAHSSMTNILIEEIDPRVKLISGRIKPMTMMSGLDTSFDGVIMIGVHAMAGSTGILAHTMYGVQISALFHNGKEIGEMAMNTAAATSFGVPVIMMSGDTSAEREAYETVSPDVKFAVVKEDISRFTATLLPPSVAQGRIKELAKKAVAELKKAKVPEIPARTTYKIRFHSSAEAMCAALIPDVKLVDSRTVSMTSTNAAKAHQLMLAAMMLGHAGQDKAYG